LQTFGKYVFKITSLYIDDTINQKRDIDENSKVIPEIRVENGTV
jgi:hypothetical protein